MLAYQRTCIIRTWMSFVIRKLSFRTTTCTTRIRLGFLVGHPISYLLSSVGTSGRFSCLQLWAQISASLWWYVRTQPERTIFRRSLWADRRNRVIFETNLNYTHRKHRSETRRWMVLASRSGYIWLNMWYASVRSLSSCSWLLKLDKFSGSGHEKLPYIENFTYWYLPNRTTAKFQKMDQGIIVFVR